MNEQRNFTRIQSELKAQVNFNENTYQGQVLDISLKGVLINIPDIPLSLKDLCEIKIPLHSTGIVMSFHSILVHKEGSHLGFRFKDEDLQSIVHLRRLLELNVDDPQKITEELFFLVDREHNT